METENKEDKDYEYPSIIDNNDLKTIIETNLHKII